MRIGKKKSGRQKRVVSDPFYRSTIWRRLRKQTIERDKGICQPCKREGKNCFPNKYKTVDHLIPRKTENIDLVPMPENFIPEKWEEIKKEVRQRGPDILINLELSCKPQHDKKRGAEKKKVQQLIF